jgi:hypothetical protein
MDLGYQYLGMLPLLAVDLVGIILAAVRWRRHPMVSLLALCGLALATLTMLAQPFVYRFGAPFMENGLGWSLSLVYPVISFVFSGVYAGSTAMLVAAIFGWRQPPAAVPSVLPAPPPSPFRHAGL